LILNVGGYTSNYHNFPGAYSNLTIFTQYINYNYPIALMDSGTGIQFIAYQRNPTKFD